jgi:anti-sigma regulatory factor (Ser/Thr protein kinase)
MDEFVITIPREPTFSVVADLVVGGIAARHEFTLDVLDDLQLALDSLLRHGEDEDGDVTVEVRVVDGEIAAVVGPVPDMTVAELERDAGGDIGLRRLLETTVDVVSMSQRDGAVWVELRKDFAFAGADG